MATPHRSLGQWLATRERKLRAESWLRTKTAVEHGPIKRAKPQGYRTLRQYQSLWFRITSQFKSEKASRKIA
jgi:hypothetical protein